MRPRSRPRPMRSTGSRTSSCSTSRATGESIGRNLKGGGWAFQFANDYYPDLDDTAVVAWAMHQAPNAAEYTENVSRALDWLVGMQSKNGGFAAFDADNTSYYLNKIPVRRSWRAARPADQRCERARGDGARAHRPPAGRARARARDRLFARRAGAGRLVVRTMGHELRLRHLVGAHGVRAGAESPRTIRRCAARWIGCSRGKIRTADGARPTTAT